MAGEINLQASLQQLSQGGIPLRARERLSEEAGPTRRLFTSDLSVNEYLLARDAGCEPISQVMGSCIYHIGEVPDYKGRTGEIETISDAHRESRRQALSRIWQEAVLVGADAVIGARLRERPITMGKRGKGGDDGGQIIEFTVVGTAVRAPWITHPANSPVVTDLSGQDLWALYQEGWEPCLFLFEFCRYHGWHVTNSVGGSGEIDPANNVVFCAREIAEERVLAQAVSAGAEFVVGSDLKIDIREVPCGYMGCALDDLEVDVSWFGTAIRRIPGWNSPPLGMPPLMLSMITLGKRKGADIGNEEDDTDEIERAGEEAEENAKAQAEMLEESE